MAYSVQDYRAECTAAFKAQALMRGWGGIAVGTLSADFGLTELSDNFGWVVTGYHDPRQHFDLRFPRPRSG